MYIYIYPYVYIAYFVRTDLYRSCKMYMYSVHIANIGIMCRQTWTILFSSSLSFITRALREQYIRCCCQIAMSFLNYILHQPNRFYAYQTMPTREHFIWWVDGRTTHCVTVSVSLIHEFIPSHSYAHTLSSLTYSYSLTHISSLKLKLCTKFITSDELKQNRHQKFESINEKNHYSQVLMSGNFIFSLFSSTPHLCDAYNNFQNRKYVCNLSHSRMEISMYIYK